MAQAWTVASELFGRMTTAHRERIVQLWEAGALADDVAGPEVEPILHEQGLLTLVAPQPARRWMLSGLGYQVLGYALQWRDQRARTGGMG